MKIKEMVNDYINSICDPKKAEFDRGLIDTKFEIKGTKTRQIDDFAKSLVKINADFYELPLENYEEILLAGCFIGNSKASSEEKVQMLKRVLPYIDNWGLSDAIIARLKGLESEKQFFVDLLKDERPFYVRVGIVWLMKYQLKSDLKNVINLVSQVKLEHYYVKMAIAWCYAETFVYDYDYMYNFVKTIDDVFIRNKTITKACESYRVSPDKKQELKALKLYPGQDVEE